MEGFLRKTKKKRVAVIKTGGDKAVNKNRGGMGAERGAETIDIAEVKICRAGDVINVGVKRKRAVEDDTQTFDLRGGGD